jgi:inorganic pyrophosphatase
MSVEDVKIGKNPPHEINVIIEIPYGSNIKYEMDKDSGMIFVDRFIPMNYPCNYGYIPHTLSGDGDPADVLVVGKFALQPGVVIACRPIAVLLMEDESGTDEKILAVPTNKLSQEFVDINGYKDLPEITINTITHFFEHYKDLEKNKWVKVLGWDNAEKAMELINEAIERAKK